MNTLMLEGKQYSNIGHAHVYKDATGRMFLYRHDRGSMIKKERKFWYEVEKWKSYDTGSIPSDVFSIQGMEYCYSLLDDYYHDDDGILYVLNLGRQIVRLDEDEETELYKFIKTNPLYPEVKKEPFKRREINSKTCKNITAPAFIELQYPITFNEVRYSCDLFYREHNWNEIMAMEYINIKFTDSLTPITAATLKPDNWRDIVAVNPYRNFITAPKGFSWEIFRDKIRNSHRSWNPQSREWEYCPPKIPLAFMIYYLIMMKYIKTWDKNGLVELEVNDELHYPEFGETTNYGYPIGNEKDFKGRIVDLMEEEIYRSYLLSEDGTKHTYEAWKNIHHQNTTQENNKSYYKAYEPAYNYGYDNYDTDE